MRWEELDRRFPSVAWPTSGDAIGLANQQIAAALTHLARVALGFPAAPIADLTEVIRETWQARLVLRGRALSDLDAGPLALIAAHEHAWDFVAAFTGGGMLPARVARTKTFPDSVAGLARHLATAAHARLPAAHVVTAMDELRGRFAADQVDARVAVIAARIFARDIVAAVDVVAATRSWLAGEPVALEPAEAPRAVADGDDARVTIFERYQPELSDDAAIDRALAAVHDDGPIEPWSRDLAGARRPYDEAVIRGFVARRPLPDGWQRDVDPVVASWLGAPESPAILRRLSDLRLLAGRSMKLDRGWDEPVKALAFGDPESVPLLTGGGTVPTFAAGKFFKDDGRKLVRYLASAILADAAVADVEPAWLDFLARRSPATTPMLERAELRWWHLLAIQSAITHRIGKAPRESTGRALQRIVTGV